MLQVIESVPEKLSPIAAFRKNQGLSQQYVAEQLQERKFDISVTGYQRFERGESRIHWGDPQFVEAVAQILGTTRPNLLAMSGHLPPKETAPNPVKQRIMDIIDELETEADDTLDTVEAMLRAIANQKRRKDR